MQEQLQRGLGVSSARPPGEHERRREKAAGPRQWFEQEIVPLLDRNRALTEASLQRKMAHLRESVVAVLQTFLARRQGGRPDDHAGGWM